MYTQEQVLLLQRLKALFQRKKYLQLLNESLTHAKAHPKRHEFRNFAGTAYFFLGELPKAIEQFKAAVAISGANADIYYNIAEAYLALAKEEMAIKFAEKALTVNPRHTKVLSLLQKTSRADLGERIVLQSNGFRYLDAKEYDQAADAFSKARDLGDTSDFLKGYYFWSLAEAANWIELAKHENEIKTLGLGETPTPLLVAQTLDDDDEREYQRAKLYCKFQGYRNTTYPKPAKKERPAKLKIGYFSADFHNHPGMHLMLGLLGEHDRDRFEVHAFSYGPDRDPPMRTFIKKKVDQFHDISGKTDDDIVQFARSLDIDIALHRNGHTKNTRNQLFCKRPAPLQINYLGYPGTLGGDFVDYIVGDPTVIPEQSRPFFTEKVIYLPHSYQPNNNARYFPEAHLSRKECGLPEDAFVFCCFNKINKVSSTEFRIWLKLLKQVEGSVLWLLADTPLIHSNVRAFTSAQGVDPDRVLFAPRVNNNAHLMRMKTADLMLDTFRYNAHTTASDALWMGLPVVTKTGNSFASRVCASLLGSAGLPELITDDESSYFDLSLELATNRLHLDELRQKLNLLRTECPLFNTQLYTRHMEDGFDAIYDRRVRGEKPDHVFVTPRST